ncbi:TPA: hypothetical protein RZC51_000717 [Burkholderia cenocepacia]|nr:hypothetical protein [Burkholderia cenocepacia]
MTAGGSAIGFPVDTSSAGTGALTTSSHGARSMGASIDGAAAIPNAGAAGVVST